MRRSVAVFTSILAAALCFAAACGLASAADAAQRSGTPEQIIAHHFATIAAGDLDAVMSDYADDAMVITAAGIAHGKAAIRAQFAQLVRAPRTGTATPQRRRGPDIIEKHFTPNVAWLIWVQNRGKPNELRGVETYLIRDGKIHLETVGTVSMHPASAASTTRQ